MTTTLEELTQRVAAAVGEDAGLGRTFKVDLRGEGFIHIDGASVKGTQGQFFPGRHTIRIVSGGMAAETFLDAQAGRVYTIEPMLGISIGSRV